MTASDLRRDRRLALGRRLREIREELGYTQKRLALNAGMDRSFYVDIENGHHSVQLERLYGITDALNLEMKDLFTNTPADGLGMKPNIDVMPELLELRRRLDQVIAAYSRECRRPNETCVYRKIVASDAVVS